MIGSELETRGLDMPTGAFWKYDVQRTRGMYVRAQLVASGALRPQPRKHLRPVHVPERYARLPLDEAGKGAAYRECRREFALIEKERAS